MHCLVRLLEESVFSHPYENHSDRRCVVHGHRQSLPPPASSLEPNLLYSSLNEALHQRRE